MFLVGTPEAIYDFADYIYRNASRPVALPVSKAWQTRSGSILAMKESLQSASVLYTTDTADWDCENYEWIEIPAELDTAKRRLSARIPAGAEYFFVNGLSSEGTLFSSSMRKVEADPAFEGLS